MRTAHNIIARRTVRIGLVGVDDGTTCSLLKARKPTSEVWQIQKYPGDAQAFLRVANRDPLDVLLVDTNLSKASGTDCVRRLQVLLPRLRVIMVSSSEEDELVLGAFMAGACGYLCRPVAPSAIVTAISRVLQGFYGFSEVAQQNLLRAIQPAGNQASFANLTAREAQIMGCALGELQYKEIAEKLHIGRGTVHAHFARIFRKLRAHSRAEAVRKFMLASKGKHSGRSHEPADHAPDLDESPWSPAPSPTPSGSYTVYTTNIQLFLVRS